MTNSTDEIHQEIMTMLKGLAPNAQVYKHEPSRTSEESMKARFNASGLEVTGAKALLIRIETAEDPKFAVVVLPGFNKLNSVLLKKQLKERIVGFKRMRFATSEEMAQKARGIEPGKMPPFGRPFFPLIDFCFIDSSLSNHTKIGFNAADFESSVIMDTDQYLKIVKNDGVFACSKE